MGIKKQASELSFILVKIFFLCFFSLSNNMLAFAQEGKEIQDPFTYLIENGSRMIRENEVEKIFQLIDRLPPEKRADFRIRVIENFTSLKAYLLTKRKEFGKKWQSDYKPMVYTGNKSAIPILIDLLKDQDPYIRAFTVRALAYLGDQSVLETLKQLSQTDPNSKVRSRAKWAYEHLSGGKLPKEDLKED